MRCGANDRGRERVMGWEDLREKMRRKSVFSRKKKRGGCYDHVTMVTAGFCEASLLVSYC